RPTDCETAARRGETSPVPRARRARRIFRRLVRGSAKRDDVALVVHSICCPSFDGRKSRGQRRLLPAQRVNRTAQVGNFKLERGNLLEMRLELGEALAELAAQLPPRDGNYRAQDADKLLVAVVSEQPQGIWHWLGERAAHRLADQTVAGLGTPRVLRPE